MSNLVRIVCSKIPGGTGVCDIAVQHLGLDIQLFISLEAAEDFIHDCYGWEAARFDSGYAIEVSMRREDWAAWLTANRAANVPCYFLSCSPEGGSCIGGLALGSKRTMILPPDEAKNFINDCYGWDSDQFSAGYSVVVLMTAHDWAAWLEGFEIVGSAKIA